MGQQEPSCNAEPALCAAFTRQADKSLPGGSKDYILVIEEASELSYRMRIDMRSGGAITQGQTISMSFVDTKVDLEMYDDLMASLIRTYKKVNGI